jgi:pimeloyl-ACP methyl ester carboxylesterase
MPYCNELFYRIYENGEIERNQPPVVLIHGSGGSHMAWPAEIRRIRGRRVIALDLPGHGQSEGAACQSLTALLNCLQRFFQEIGIRNVSLIGHSLGAILALKFAVTSPSLVEKLVLLACGSSFAIPEELLVTLQPFQREQFCEKFSQIAFDRSFPQAERRVIVAPLAKMRANILIMDFKICSAYKIPSNLGKVNCPVMLINGSSDIITTPLSARQLAYTLPQASATILPQCGHMLLQEKTALISQMIRGFFL